MQEQHLIRYAISIMVSPLFAVAPSGSRTMLPALPLLLQLITRHRQTSTWYYKATQLVDPRARKTTAVVMHRMASRSDFLKPFFGGGRRRSLWSSSRRVTAARPVSISNEHYTKTKTPLSSFPMLPYPCAIVCRRPASHERAGHDET
jgi:hypothetical protein